MNYEEKLIRYIASKLIQRRYFMKKGGFPDEKTLARYINFVCKELKEKYRDLKYVRNKSESGLITPLIEEVVFKMKIL
jgi:hypothetical protein